MPLLSIETNQPTQGDALNTLLDSASALVADTLGKSENFVMVRFSYNENMLFAGSGQAMASLQLKSIGLPKSATARLSTVLCDFIEARLKVPKNRIYIEFIDVSHNMWGYDGHTF